MIIPQRYRREHEQIIDKNYNKINYEMNTLQNQSWIPAGSKAKDRFRKNGSRNSRSANSKQRNFMCVRNKSADIYNLS